MKQREYGDDLAEFMHVKRTGDGHNTASKTEPDQQTDALAHAVIGAAIEVHRHLGPGYLESVYEQALCMELEIRGIPFERQAPVMVKYKVSAVGEGRLDLLVGGVLIVELKAVTELAPIHTAQVISYLKATGCKLALLLNFNVQVLKQGISRIINPFVP